MGLKTTYDIAVVGQGIYGTVIAAKAVSLGMSVVTFDPRGRGSAHSSSSGKTRIFRQTIIEHPDYLELAKNSDKQWRKLNATHGAKIIGREGLAIVSQPGTSHQKHHSTTGIHNRSVQVADSNNIPYSTMSGGEFSERFRLCVDADSTVFYERSAYVLNVDEIFAAYGAILRDASDEYREPVHDIIDPLTTSEYVEVRTPKRTVLAKHVVLALGAGAASSRLTSRYFRDVSIYPQPVAWFRHSTATKFPSTVITTRDLPLLFAIPGELTKVVLENTMHSRAHSEVFSTLRDMAKCHIPSISTPVAREWC